MRFKYFLVPVLFLGLFILGCTQATPTKPLIERNSEVKEYFEAVNELIDEYFNMIEQLMESAAEIDAKEKNGEEASIFDGFTMLTDMASSTLKIMRLAEKIEKMEVQQKEFEDDLSSQDFEEFLKIYTKTFERFYELAKKAEELEKNK